MGTFEAPQADSPSDEPEHRKRQAASGTPSAPYVRGNMSLDHAAAASLSAMPIPIWLRLCVGKDFARVTWDCWRSRAPSLSAVSR